MKQAEVGIVVWIGLVIGLASCSDVPADGTTVSHRRAQAEYDRGNYPEAVRLWRVLAGEGHAEAQYSLGVAYHLGSGVPRDNNHAREWFLQAADQGHATAMQMLGFLYLAGWDVPQDYVMAHMWYNLSAAHGGTSAPGRDRVAEMMTPAQVAEAQRLAREWMAERSRPPN